MPHIYGTEYLAKKMPMVKDLLESAYLLTGVIDLGIGQTVIAAGFLAGAYKPVFVCYATIAIGIKVASIINKKGR